MCKAVESADQEKAHEMVEVTVQIAGAAGEKTSYKPVSVSALFRYCDCQDRLLLAAAGVAVFISGANQPLQVSLRL